MATIGSTYRHEGTFGDPQELCGSVVLPAVREALADGRRVLLCIAAELSDTVLTDLGPAAGVSVVRDPALGDRTPVALLAYRELVQRESAQAPVMLVTDGSGHTAGWDSWMETEALLNTTLADLPVQHLCLIDLAAAPEGARVVARQTHPLLRTEDGVHMNPDYRPPEDVVAELGLHPAVGDPLESTEPVLAFLDVEDPRVLRRRLTAVLRDSALTQDAAQDFVLAIDEVTANAAEHGVPPVDVRLWTSTDRLVCSITDRGSCFDDPTAGYGPAHHGDPALGGMGLWLARRSVDSLTAERTEGGCVVRLVIGA